MKKKRTQNKENYYYVFWVIAMIAFIVPQIFTAYGIMKITDFLDNKGEKVLIFKNHKESSNEN
tara:strand:- start:336 stop:524 length:189 start_codon:yes stop_codon:yes gene_type:complete